MDQKKDPQEMEKPISRTLNENEGARLGKKSFESGKVRFTSQNDPFEKNSQKVQSLGDCYNKEGVRILSREEATRLKLPRHGQRTKERLSAIAEVNC